MISGQVWTRLAPVVLSFLLPPSRCGRLGLTACGPFSRHQMIGALETVAQLCALGLGLGRNDITSLMHEGPHLLAPTGEPDCADENRARALDRTNSVHRQYRKRARGGSAARGGGKRVLQRSWSMCLGSTGMRDESSNAPSAPPISPFCKRLAPIACEQEEELLTARAAFTSVPFWQYHKKTSAGLLLPRPIW